jgi:hypothetical protein
MTASNFRHIGDVDGETLSIENTSVVDELAGSICRPIPPFAGECLFI